MKVRRARSLARRCISNGAIRHRATPCSLTCIFLSLSPCVALSFSPGVAVSPSLERETSRSADPRSVRDALVRVINDGRVASISSRANERADPDAPRGRQRRKPSAFLQGPSACHCAFREKLALISHTKGIRRESHYLVSRSIGFVRAPIRARPVRRSRDVFSDEIHRSIPITRARTTCCTLLFDLDGRGGIAAVDISRGDRTASDERASFSRRPDNCGSRRARR